MRRLYNISNIQAVATSRADVSSGCLTRGSVLTVVQKRRAVFIDSLICVLLPLMVMALGTFR